MNIYLVPARSENFKRTIEKSVNYILEEKYNKTYEKEVGAWAITNKNKCAIYGNEIKAGDKFFIFPLDESNQLVEATIIETIIKIIIPITTKQMRKRVVSNKLLKQVLTLL